MQAIDENFLRQVAEAVPQLEIEEWQTDFDDPETAELADQDAMLAAQLKLPAEPAVIVNGPAGERTLLDQPSLEEIEAAIAQVSDSG